MKRERTTQELHETYLKVVRKLDKGGLTADDIDTRTARKLARDVSR
jgi:hypothetical protein